MLLAFALSLTAPAVQASQTLRPGIVVTSHAIARPGGIIQASLQTSMSPVESGWYWEAAVQSPSEPDVDKARLQDWMLTTENASSTYPFLIKFDNDATMYGRVKVWGSLTHFRSFQETAECTLQLIQDSSTGQWRVREPVVLETPSGLRLRVRTHIKGHIYDPNPKPQLRFTVDFDRPTLRKGLDRMPERVDVWIEPPQHGIGWSPGLSVPLILPGGETSAYWTLQGEQLKPTVELKLKINRRIADRELPFSLTVPLERALRSTPKPTP